MKTVEELQAEVDALKTQEVALRDQLLQMQKEWNGLIDQIESQRLELEKLKSAG